MDFYLNKALDKNKKKQYKRSELTNYNVNRSTVTEPSGLVLEMRMDASQQKKYFIKEITPDSLFERMNDNFKIPLQVGDRVIEINKVEMDDFQGLFQMNQALREEENITISLLKEDKEKRWLHDKPMQYAGKAAPKEETFRPESKAYPPPKDFDAAAPAGASAAAAAAPPNPVSKPAPTPAPAPTPVPAATPPAATPESEPNAPAAPVPATPTTPAPSNSSSSSCCVIS
mmetsp:Transcript_16035/g.39257  ORF Transcript_16035/g.39257 Transcript_16035/m.39257 type:complete len:229 (-) Transcript_16035:156-842(-)|eukprot:CAMPEP_0113647804 /NCGR_PEP_ID=MMETSP0017_2-20120614/25330_1 /TAXON_ID=2856 /ORGANISM="Cylindrotheca closterium" /LENGTH=228 /DNA_ID=CAMNT_0000559933 /DNA_START=43 /DNA_END=729 /DNA_ORIENTATION=+ /assembly_acc=CAM_ASM_000147